MPLRATPKATAVSHNPHFPQPEKPPLSELQPAPTWLERRLLEAIARNEEDLAQREERLMAPIAALQRQLDAQDKLIAQQNEAIASLQALLQRLMSSLDVPPSSSG